MTGENRNLLLAVLLSAIVLIGWSFVSDRLMPKPAAAPPAAAPAAGAAPAPAAAVAVRPLADVLGEGGRVAIRAPALSGSISLTGARIDDLVLVRHRETIDPDSPPVRLFAPSGTARAWFGGFGWAGAGAPPADARWQASAPVLEPGRPVTLSWTSPAGVRFEQQIAIDGDYLFTVRARIINASAAPVDLRSFGYLSRAGRGEDKNSFNVHAGPLGVLDGTLHESEVNYDTLDKEGMVRLSSSGGWLGITDKYWLAALIPAQNGPIDARFAASGDQHYQTDYLAGAAHVAPGRQAEVVAHLYAGAKEVTAINAVRDRLGVPLFDRAISWGWFWFIAQPIFALLSWLYHLLGNYGLAIVGLTLIVRLILFPIANRQYASMAKMRVFAPKMKEIQDRFKDDRVRQQTEIMELYKREKINPLAGCLPILLQIPIFYALYKTLLISTEIRHQPGLLWIHDLSAPDPLTPLNLFGLIPFELPTFLHLGVLPILLGVTMFIQFRMNPAPMDEIQKKIFSVMPWVFMFMMAPFAAGLQIYWIVNNLLSIGQQWLLMRKYPAPAPAPASGK